MRRNGGIIGEIGKVTKDAPQNAKMFDLHDQHLQDEKWPDTKKILSVTHGSNLWTENTQFTVTATGEGYDAAAETLYFVINPGGCPSALFTSTSGSFTMTTGNTGTFTITTRFSADPEFTDITRDFTLQIRSGSISGPILFETGTQTIDPWTLLNPTIGYIVSNTDEGELRSIGTGYSNIGTASNWTHRWYYKFLGYTGKSNAELLQGIGLSGLTTQYEGRTLNKTPGSTGYLEFTVRAYASATIVFSMSVDGDSTCVSRMYKNGTQTHSVTGSGTQGGSIGGCTHGDVIRFEYEKPVGAGSVGNDEGELLYMYISGSGTPSGIATQSATAGGSADVTGVETSNISHPMTFYQFIINVEKDYVTEGTEVAWVQATAVGYGETGSKFHQIYEDSMTINDTSLTPVVSISPSTTTITENDGVGVTFTVTDTAHTVADTYYYSVQGTGITSADFSDGTLTGTIAMSPGGGGIQGTVNKQAIAENVSEGESFTFSARTGSTSGTVRATSSSISIVDATASTAPIYLDFYESRYGSNIGTINIYVANASTGALVSSSLYTASGNLGTTSWFNRTTSTFNASIGTSYRWVIVHQAGSSFRGDYAVDLVKYYKSGTLQWTEDWGSGGGTVGTWIYGSTAGSTSSSTTAFSNSANVIRTTGTGNGKWGVDSGSTPSGSTGPSGAFSGTYFAYTETSTYFSQYHWMFSPSFTV